MKAWPRIVLATLLAPLVPGVLFGLYECSRWNNWPTIVEAFVLGSVLFYIAMVLLALPITLVLHRRGRATRALCAVAGAFSAAMLIAVLAILIHPVAIPAPVDNSLSGILSDIASFALLGAAMGAVFHTVAFRNSR